MTDQYQNNNGAPVPPQGGQAVPPQPAAQQYAQPYTQQYAQQQAYDQQQYAQQVYAAGAYAASAAAPRKSSKAGWIIGGVLLFVLAHVFEHHVARRRVRFGDHHGR